MSQYDGNQVVRIDLHRQRSVIIRQTDTGEQLSAVRSVNDPASLALQLEKSGEHPEVVLEATSGWYWAVDALQAARASVHLAHPLGVKGFRYRRVRNDVRDGWRSGGSTADEPAARGVDRPTGHTRAARAGALPGKARRHPFGTQGTAALGARQGGPTGPGVGPVRGRRPQTAGEGPARYGVRARVISLLELIDVLVERRFTTAIADQLRGHVNYRIIQQLPGVGPVLGAVFVAEIGDAHRFPGPDRLCSWAGLTPRHHESDTVVRRGRITKQGSKLVRWAAVEAIAHQPAGTKISLDRARIEDRRGKNIAKVAAARKLLTLVYYGLRDEHIRALVHPKAAA